MSEFAYLLDSLNPEQRKAVISDASHLLVLAGAGSGKTRVLVHRVAWLVATQQATVFQLLAVTFTNKAANEMKERIGSMLHQPTKELWIGTFHGICHRMLRMHWQDAKLDRNFQIMDNGDQLHFIKRLLKEMDIPEESLSVKRLQSFINSQKEEGIRAQNIEPEDNVDAQRLVSLYKLYEQRCSASHLVDFCELLLRCCELLEHVERVRTLYHQRFRSLLIDELQDINLLQYRFMRLLCGPNSKLFAVGDDDQLIYSWRGANIERLKSLQQSFNDLQIIRLEQNYRSTSTILNAANALISNNNGRIGKELWTDQKDAGLPIDIFAAYNEKEEADYVVETIAHQHYQESLAYKDVAILFRVSAQSRLMEEALLRAGIDYQVWGGMRFYERAEIKDVLGYLRIAVNPADDSAFERVVNMPPRGIGKKTLEEIRNTARNHQIPLWQATQKIVSDGITNNRVNSTLHGFTMTINSIADLCVQKTLPEVLEYIIQSSELPAYYQKQDKGERGRSRIENLEELVRAAESAWNQESEDKLENIQTFLAQAVLESGETQSKNLNESVKLMTLHAAKGLEFAQIFLIGLEEGLLPHFNSSHSIKELEEERRLFYVGMTRSKKKLVMTYAQSRRMYGREDYPAPSRFLQEIPVNLVRHIREDSSSLSTKQYQTNPSAVHQTKQPVATPSVLSSANQNSSYQFSPGMRVSHDRFGEGVILKMDGSGAEARAQVNFYQQGTKWLLLVYAKLHQLDLTS